MCEPALTMYLQTKLDTGIYGGALSSQGAHKIMSV